MGMFCPVISLVVARYQKLNLSSKIWLLLNLVKPTSKNLKKSSDSKSALISLPAAVIVELFAVI